MLYRARPTDPSTPTVADWLARLPLNNNVRYKKTISLKKAKSLTACAPIYLFTFVSSRLGPFIKLITAVALKLPLHQNWQDPEFLGDLSPDNYPQVAINEIFSYYTLNRSNAPSPSRIPSRFLISPFECICAHNVTGSTFRSERIPPPSTMHRSSLAYWNSCTKLIAPNSRFASHGISNRSDQHFSFNFAPHNHAIRIQLSSKLHGTNGWWRLRWLVGWWL